MGREIMENAEPFVHQCPHCQTVNYAANRNCKKCGSMLHFDGMKSLEPCPDCNHLCSPTAETCPNCGRIRRLISEQSSLPLLKIIIGAVLLLALGYFVYPVLFQAKREVDVKAAISSGEPAKAGISEKNRTAAKAALNAIGEIQSVTSVGTNYYQYVSTLQSARIKYDAALRDLKPIDESEFTILKQLEEAFQSYVDAKEAWAEFVEDGDSSGFLGERNSGTVTLLSQKYGYRASGGSYFRSTVITTIWESASTKFRNVEGTLR